MVQRVSVGILLLMCSWLLFFGQTVTAQVLHADKHVACKGKQDTGCKEYELKGAYIYHFFKYIEWENESETEHFVIGVLGESPIEQVLYRLEKEKVIRNKTFDIYQFNEMEDVQKQFAATGKQPCHLLFISKKAQKELVGTTFIQTLNKKNIILLGESTDFLDKGGDINFVIDRNRLKFHINQKTLNKASGLRVSAKLLKLAVLGSNTNRNKNIDMDVYSEYEASDNDFYLNR